MNGMARVGDLKEGWQRHLHPRIDAAIGVRVGALRS